MEYLNPHNPPFSLTEVFIEKYIGGLKVSKVFLDPLGCHYLIALSPKSPGFSAELLYLHRNSNKPKYISKVSGFILKYTKFI